jgi:hypothetical protein
VRSSLGNITVERQCEKHCQSAEKAPVRVQAKEPAPTSACGLVLAAAREMGSEELGTTIVGNEKQEVKLRNLTLIMLQFAHSPTTAKPRFSREWHRLEGSRDLGSAFTSPIIEHHRLLLGPSREPFHLSVV